MDGFNLDMFKKNGNEMIDLVCRGYENIENMPIQPNVEPGFLREIIDESPPKKPEDPSKIFNSLEKDIFPLMTKWQHPSFFAYFSCVTSYPAVLAEIFVSSFTNPVFTWYSSPVTTEIENIVCDWLVQMLGLPEKFLLKNKGGGGGVNSVSEGYYLSVHYAKIKKLKELNIDNFDPKIFNLVAYFPEHSVWSKKPLFLKEIKHQRILPMYFDNEIRNYVIDVNEFEELVKKDIENNLIPFWFGATIGSTGVCSCDNLELIGPICKKFNIFLSVDAAYTGPFWCCPEFRVKGLELEDALLINYSKLGLIGIIGCFMFLDDKEYFIKTMQEEDSINDFATIKNKFTDNYDIVDYKDWTVGFGRKSNALKMFFTIRFFGIEGYQEYYRYIIEISDYCEKLIEKNDKFELICKRKYTLICFRVIKNNEGVKIDEDKLNDVNKKFKELINEKNDDGYISLGQMGNKIFLRVAIGNFKTTKEHIDKFLEKVNNCTKKI